MGSFLTVSGNFLLPLLLPRESPPRAPVMEKSPEEVLPVSLGSSSWTAGVQLGDGVVVLEDR
jgi:hypothetical protein